jgi:hypothetical protein
MDERQIQLAEKITQRVCFVIGFVGIFALLWYFVRVKP